VNEIKRGWIFGAFYGVLVFVVWCLCDRVSRGIWNTTENVAAGFGALTGAWLTANELLKKKEP